MPRPEKVQAVADIKERMGGAQAVFLAEYAGLSVQEQQALRRDLRANEAEFKVVKMTLARLAAADLDIEDLDELLLGPTGLAFADGDPVGAARVLRDFAKGHEVFVIKGGLLGREFLTPERIAELADIEPRDVLLAKIAGVFEAPMAKMAGLLAALPRNTATAMQQLLEKKEESSEPPAAADESEAEASVDAEPVDEETPAAVEETVEEETPEDAAHEAATPEEETPEAAATEAEPTESDDAETAAEASDEDAGTESVVTEEAADDAAEEE
jgi:large subunit ribosomal protein L10